MAVPETFESELRAALDARREYIIETTIPKLKSLFREMRSSFEAIHNVLKKKGNLKEDPYKYEERLNELDTPPDTPFLDNERDTVLSTRMAQYQTRLEYITDYYDFTYEHLDLRKLKELVKFVKYIKWRNLSETATQPTTRVLAEQVMKIKRGSDPLSANIMSDAQEQMNRIAGGMEAALKEITNLAREEYKLQLREVIFADGAAPIDPAPAAIDAAANKVKALLPKRLPGVPFARELVLEIFTENSEDGGAAARQALLDSLRIPKQAAPAKKAGPDLRAILIDAVRTVAQSSRPLEEVVRKLNDNSIVMESRKLTFGEMLRRIFERMRGNDSEEHVYPIEYMDDATNTRSHEDLSFESFIHALSKRSKRYAGLMSRTGSAAAKLEALDEERLLRFVMSDIQELTQILKQVEALDTYFRAEVSREQRQQLRGVNVELTTMREHLTRGRKRAHEYVAKMEEIEQLRKLGIDQ